MPGTRVMKVDSDFKISRTLNILLLRSKGPDFRLMKDLRLLPMEQAKDKRNRCESCEGTLLMDFTFVFVSLRVAALEWAYLVLAGLPHYCPCTEAHGMSKSARQSSLYVIFPNLY